MLQRDRVTHFASQNLVNSHKNVSKICHEGGLQ